MGLEKLRAESWRQVAILSPRKAWLRSLRDALLDVDLPAEVQSESDLRAENPAYAWLTALLAIIVDPNASYEIVGVLREVFGLSDDELARFAQGRRGAFPDRGTNQRTRSGGRYSEFACSPTPSDSAAAALQRGAGSCPPDPAARTAALAPAGNLSRAGRRAGQTAERGRARRKRAGFRSPILRAACGRNYNAIRESNPTSANAIQLITAHKAKGSEWQAVIVPFLTRKVWGAIRRYPSLIQAGRGRSLRSFSIRRTRMNSKTSWNWQTVRKWSGCFTSR